MIAMGLIACEASDHDQDLLGEVTPGGLIDTARDAFPFTDITEDSGVRFVHENGGTGRRHYPENMGAGAALFDADGDGDLDLYLVNGGSLEDDSTAASVNRLYRNDGSGRFEDVTAVSGAADAGYGMGVAVGDVDGDLDLDLYVLNYGPNALYRNLGDGTFELMPEAGVEGSSWSVSGAFFDADGDQDLDLYVANYLVYDLATAPVCRAGTLTIYCSPEQFEPARDRLYRNDGGRFVDISDPSGLRENGRGMGVVAAHLDDDLAVDLYITNDRSPNFLYRSRDGRLQEVGASRGVSYSPVGMAEGGMGVVAADVLASGSTSLFLTNFQKEPNRLYVAAGEFFDDLSLTTGLGLASMETVGWGAAALDLEGDADLDLVVANGHVFDNAAEFIPGSSWQMADQLFTNKSDRGEREFSPRDFTGAASSSRGVAAGDIDGDGDVDLVITSCGGPARVWRNDAGVADRFLVVRLRSAAENARAVSARLDVLTADGARRHQVVGGGSYASASEDRLHLGLGPGGVADRLTVRWPNGDIETLTDQSGGREVVWRQGRGVVAERRLEVGTALPEQVR